MKADVVVIGSGIVGLATAYQILDMFPGINLIVLEKESAISQHQTGNNSGVIHSGLYYKPGSLKAENCIRGYQLLLEFCERENVKFEICGKVVVATSEEEIPLLQNLYHRGQENGLKGLKKLSKDALKDHEPHVNGLEAIFVPQTGIIDYKQVSQKLAQKIKASGGVILTQHQVKQVIKENSNIKISTSQQNFDAKIMVNCAGLYSDKIARLTHPQLDIRIIPFRGEYYKLKPDKRQLVKNLIYPVPDPNFPFLGVHFTRMIDGNVEAGPNAVLAFAREGYSKKTVDLREFAESVSWPGFLKVAGKYWQTGLGEMYRSFSKAAFTKALKRLIPEVTAEDLQPGGAGVRAQACDRHGGLLDDFVILEDKHVVNVCNAPSPAATSALAIGEKIAKMTIQKLSGM